MTTSVQKNKYGPFWPQGCILVPTPGTPVRLTSLIDPNSVNAPEAATSSTADEYTPAFHTIFLQGYTTNGAPGNHGLVPNSGNIYVIIKGGAGSNNRDDSGSILYVLGPGLNLFLNAAELNLNAFNPYQFWFDADTANDGVLAVGVVG